ncbi:LytR/AlgR family response regulator transcription factor [Lacrimispora sp.]|uniref:LytR/AlgR family response regulator transcription factor n=1 Tax=Lacrimispora sp. TaxID=2719234 RepID=UPI002FDB6E59
MLEVGICDDDRFLLREMEERLKRLGVKHEVDICIETYTDGEDIVKAVNEGKCFDIIYMDIEMKRLNGLAAAQKIRELDLTVQIIFVSSFEKYMKETFKVAPIGFIDKPFSEKVFAGEFEHVLRHVRKEDKYYRFRFAKENYKVPVKEVMYFERKYRVTEIIWTGENYKLYRDLETIEKDLKDINANFIRIHKSFLVNYQHIARFSSYFVELQNGICLPVSRSRKPELEMILQNIEDRNVYRV